MVDVSKLLGLERLDKVMSRFIKEPVKFLPSQCYTYRDKTYKCEKCVEVCHAGALTLENQAITIDLKLCDGCGLCYSICPTGAFQLEVDNRTVLSRIKLFSENDGAVVCKCVKTKDKDEVEEEASALETICLGRLDESLLLGAAALGAESVWLDASACNDCAYNASGIIEGHVKNSMEILRAFGSKTEILFSSDEPAGGSAPDSADLTELEKNTRRDFFSGIGKSLMSSGSNVVGERIDKVMESISPTDKPIYDSNIPEKRSILLIMLSHLGKPVEERLKNESALIADITITNFCVFCNNCTTFCPTDALTRTKGDLRGIEFNPSLCVNCGLCEFVCLNDSLKIDGNPTWKELILRDKKVLIEGGLYQCSKCHQYFESAARSSECHACKLRRSKLGDDSWY